MHPNVRNPNGCNGILVRSVGRGCSSKREDITFFLHTKIEIARKIGCQNIHLSIPVLKGLSETEKKALTEDFCEISISCHSMEDVEIAMAGEYNM